MKNPRRLKEWIGFLVIVAGPLDVFVGFKLALEDWLWAGLGLGLATLLSWLYWVLYAAWLERVSGK